MKPAKMDLEDFGYLMEEVILFATELGLGTCWLGGTITRSSFARKIGLKDDESMPAVTATGLMDDPEQARRSLIRRVARGQQRLSWEMLFSKDRFALPLPRREAGDFATSLEMVRLAPSASNRQPWRIIKNGDSGTFTCIAHPATAMGSSSAFCECLIFSEWIWALPCAISS